MNKNLGRLGATLAISATALLAGAAPASADHLSGPCGNDGAGNSGYAAHHIVSFAHAGRLGDGGHKPGSHRGFSLCNPSGN